MARWTLIAMTMLLASGAAAVAAPKRGGPVECIDANEGGQSAENEATLVVHGSSGRVYRNHLTSSCPGLMRLNSFGALLTERHGSQLCRGDVIAVIDTNAVGGIPGPRCVLGMFEPAPDLARPPRR